MEEEDTDMVASKSSYADLVWIWVIEAVASFREVDFSLLNDLVKAAPEIPDDDLGKNAIEMVALKSLETLFERVTTDVPSSDDQHFKATFDLSESCENVLSRILQESSESSQLSQWDIHPFLKHKRASMKKCTLVQLKEAILSGTSHPYADILKEKGLLASTNDVQCTNFKRPKLYGSYADHDDQQSLDQSSAQSKGREALGDSSKREHEHDLVKIQKETMLETPSNVVTMIPQEITRRENESNVVGEPCAESSGAPSIKASKSVCGNKKLSALIKMSLENMSKGFGDGVDTEKYHCTGQNEDEDIKNEQHLIERENNEGHHQVESSTNQASCFNVSAAVKEDNVSDENTDMALLNQEKTCEIMLEVVKEQNTDSPKKPTYELSINHCSTILTTPQLRRKRLQWTAAELQKLKEGVQIFSDRRKIPWRKILESSSVFQKGRTAVDLKDKWKNMCKGTPESK
ncbi:uncharacterized protein LOC133829555 isoform X2 [Humulus lupulus]|uniref:uncharacterized protein LOC133829555 isoform X2 n=1 Tax=Humulus lupulus TaxID=3486 RepID=UPI002B404833|nr:uncharacterized protein LOC133829555 isoform X2 [Humulus lupulus]